jgi:hypothetical protein
MPATPFARVALFRAHLLTLPDPRAVAGGKSVISGAVRAGLCACLLYAASTQPSAAQDISATPEDAATAVSAHALSLVRWNGSLPQAAGHTVEVKFSLFQDAAGGLALWSEMQTVNVGADGRYTVLLGATGAEGLPQTLFQAGEARWIEATPVSGATAGEANRTPARSLLAVVPYAFKAQNSAELDGRPGSDYVTREELQPAAAAAAQAAGQVHAETTPTGSGTTGYVPLWTATTTLGNAPISVSGVNVGIGTATPVYPLDVNGTETLRGNLKLEPNGNATAKAGLNSSSIEFQGSTYSSTAAAPVSQYFIWQLFPTGNNTANPSSMLGLSTSTGSASPKPTGFSINQAGQLSFAAGQTFPAANLETTLNTVYAGLSAKNTFTSGATFGGQVTADENGSPGFALAGVATGGGIGISASSDTGIAASFTNSSSPNPTVSAVNNANSDGSTYPEALNGTANGTGSIGVIGTGEYTGIWGASPTAYAGYFKNANNYPTLYASNSGFVGGTGLEVVSNSGDGADIYADGNSGDALYAYTAGTGYALFAESTSADAVHGLKATVSSVSAGVFGINANHSGTYAKAVSAGVWGDTGTAATNNLWNAGVNGTADNAMGGMFLNNTTSWPTVYAHNYATGGATGLFKVLMAGDENGTCGVGSGGDLNCTGRVKALVTVGEGKRTVETYSVQSPENWMEDFGSGKLVRGVAQIAIDPAFAETVSATADYHVFLTPRGDSKGLYVINATAAGFEVRESGGGTSSLAFDYRIVARRRGFETERLVDVSDKFRSETAVVGPRRARVEEPQQAAKVEARRPARQPLQARQPQRLQVRTSAPAIQAAKE